MPCIPQLWEKLQPELYWKTAGQTPPASLVSHLYYSPAPDAIQPAALRHSAHHLAASALQTHLESLPSSPAFCFLLLASPFSLLQLSLCSFTWFLPVVLTPLQSDFSRTPNQPLLLPSNFASLICWPLIRYFFHFVLGFLWLLGTTPFDDRTGSHSTDFTWHQLQTWQIDVYVPCFISQALSCQHSHVVLEWDQLPTKAGLKTHSEQV